MENVIPWSLRMMGHNGVITEDGSLYMWGYSHFAAVGNGTNENQLVPIKIMENVKLPTNQLVSQTQEIMVLSLFGNGLYKSTKSLQNASFGNLIPNTTYNFYVMKDKDVVDAFDSSNLLYLSQKVSDDAGNLSVFYQAIEQSDNADVFVVPMKQTDLSLAQVELENLAYIGSEQYVNPVVKLNGKTLQEGKDYELVGEYSALEIGKYTVTVQGIGLYKGKVNVTYEVIGTEEDIFADLIRRLRDADKGEIVKAEIRSTTLLSKEVLDVMRGRDVTLELSLNNGVKWSINGTNVVASLSVNGNDLYVMKKTKENGNISMDVISDLAGRRDAEQLVFGQNDSFDFVGEFTLEMTDGINAEKAVMLQNIGGTMRLVDSALVINGAISFAVDKGADSIIIYGTNGDTDGDGRVDNEDMMQILYHISNRTMLNEAQQGFADVDMNDSVNIQDLLRELHYVTGRSNTLYEAK